MGKITYITGGSRSGKSYFAEQCILETKKDRIYVATAIAFDDEMKQRVRLHKKQRGENWITIEAHTNIPALLLPYKESQNIILLDCLTNLVSNRMFDLCEDWDSVTPENALKIETLITQEISEFLNFIKNSPLELVVVTNELGMGLVPVYALGRHFRDICGRINQLVAKEAQNAYFLVSGLPITLK